MKRKQTTACVGSMSAVMWGKAVGYGIASGTLLGTVVGVAMKNSMLVYIGMVLGCAIGAMFKSKQPRSD